MIRSFSAITIACLAILGISSQPGLATTPASESEPAFTIGDAVDLKTVLRTTATKITLTNAEIKEFLWEKKLAFVDLTAVVKPIENVLNAFAISDIMLNGDRRQPLLIIKLKKPVTFSAASTNPLKTKNAISVIDFSQPASGSIKVDVAGIFYGDQQVKSFLWTNPKQLQVLVADGTLYDLDMAFLDSFVEKFSENWQRFATANSAELSPGNVIAGLIEFLNRFKTTAKDNRIQIKIASVQKFVARLKSAVKKDTAKDGPFQPLIDGVAEVNLTPAGIFIDLKKATQIRADKGAMAFAKQIVVSPNNKEAIFIAGIHGAQDGGKWFPISNATFIKDAEFPFGALRVTVRAEGPAGGKHTVYKYLEFPDAFTDDH